MGADVLLGMARARAVGRPTTGGLERHRPAIEKRDPEAKRQIAQLLETVIEREKLKRSMNVQGA